MSIHGHQPPDPVRRDTVRGLLQGFGSDDIALIWGHDAAEVRGIIVRLRDSGALRGIVDQARDAR